MRFGAASSAAGLGFPGGISGSPRVSEAVVLLLIVACCLGIVYAVRTA
jgi:hypothetical protein